MSYGKSISLRQLEILNGIVVGGSIRKAARLLDISQPTVSGQLAKLEANLGAELINRDRQRSTLLTQAGDHWARIARQVLHEIEDGCERHERLFGGNDYALTFATIPPHLGRIVGLASRLARDRPSVSEFSVKWALSSPDVHELLEVRKANIALMALADPEGKLPGYKTRVLYDDRMIWAVPRAVDEAQARRALSGEIDNAAPDLPGALTNRVVVELPHYWRDKSDAWYSTHLPAAKPYFWSDLHRSALEMVSEGLATCHISTTLLMNLSPRLHETVRFFETGITAQRMGLVMPKQMASNPTLLDFFDRLAEGIEAHYQGPAAAAERAVTPRQAAARRDTDDG